MLKTKKEVVKRVEKDWNTKQSLVSLPIQKESYNQQDQRVEFLLSKRSDEDKFFLIIQERNIWKTLSDSIYQKFAIILTKEDLKQLVEDLNKAFNSVTEETL